MIRRTEGALLAHKNKMFAKECGKMGRRELRARRTLWTPYTPTLKRNHNFGPMNVRGISPKNAMPQKVFTRNLTP